MRTAVHLLYAYYSRNRQMLGRVLRDADEMPALAEAAAGFSDYTRAIADGLLTAWNAPTSHHDALRAVLHHAVRFSTWASLEAAGVNDAAKSHLLAAWAVAISTEAPPAGSSGQPIRG